MDSSVKKELIDGINQLYIKQEQSHCFVEMLTFNFEVDDKYSFIVTKELVTVDDGKEKTYLVPSSNNVFSKIVRAKAQIIITLYNVTQQIACFDNCIHTVKKGNLVFMFKSPNQFAEVCQQFKDAEFEIVDQK